jgi:hypothetical protein
MCDEGSQARLPLVRVIHYSRTLPVTKVADLFSIPMWYYLIAIGYRLISRYGPNESAMRSVKIARSVSPRVIPRLPRAFYVEVNDVVMARLSPNSATCRGSRLGGEKKKPKPKAVHRPAALRPSTLYGHEASLTGTISSAARSLRPSQGQQAAGSFRAFSPARNSFLRSHHAKVSITSLCINLYYILLR